MATRIIHRRGKGVPAASEFASVGEILIDTDTGTGYTLREPDGAVVALGGEGSGSGTGAGLVISPTEPADPVDGMQWLDSTTARVWVWDEDKWLEFPAAGGSVEGSGLIEVSEEPPEPPYEIGQQWFSSADGYLYLWFGAEWVAVNMPTSSGGTDPEPEPTDPYYSQTTLLMQFDDEGLPWKDDGYRGGVAFKPVNDPATSDAESKHGGRSLLLNLSGTSNSRLEATGFPNKHLLYECTVEMWVYATSSAGTTGTSKRTIFTGTGAIGGHGCLTIHQYGSNVQVVTGNVSGNINNFVTTGGLLTTNEWHHIAFTRDGSASGQLKLYIDGYLAGSDAVVSGASYSTEIEIGSSKHTSAKKFSGYIDDVRITDGAVRYTGTFEPPGKLPTAGTRNLMLEERSMDNDADLS